MAKRQPLVGARSMGHLALHYKAPEEGPLAGIKSAFLEFLEQIGV